MVLTNMLSLLAALSIAAAAGDLLPVVIATGDIRDTCCEYTVQHINSVSGVDLQGVYCVYTRLVRKMINCNDGSSYNHNVLVRRTSLLLRTINND